jgi:hypothetical protein
MMARLERDREKRFRFHKFAGPQSGFLGAAELPSRAILELDWLNHRVLAPFSRSGSQGCGPGPWNERRPEMAEFLFAKMQDRALAFLLPIAEESDPRPS